MPDRFLCHIPEKLEETGVYGLAPPGGVPPFVAPTGAPTVPGPGFWPNGLIVGGWNVGAPFPDSNISRIRVSIGVLPTSRTKNSCSMTWGDTARIAGKRSRRRPNRLGWAGYWHLKIFLGVWFGRSNFSVLESRMASVQKSDIRVWNLPDIFFHSTLSFFLNRFDMSRVTQSRSI